MPSRAIDTSYFSILFLVTGLLAVGLLSCELGCEKASFQSSKEIPAGLRDVAPTTLKGKLSRAWGGDNFEFGQKQQLHYFFMIGIDCPESGQPFYKRAHNYLIERCFDREMDIEVLMYDELKREVGHAWVTEADGKRVNLAIDLLSNGFGWYDGNEFEGAEQYREAMESARAKKLGLWSQPNPTPPWEHWKKTQDVIRGKK